jgi:potassium efflux system protein
MIRTIFCFVFLISACGGISAQGLQKLLEGGKEVPSGEKPQPSATEQKNWAIGKLAEFQAKEKALNVEELREEFRRANLSEARLDEFLSASREIIRHYEAAVDTLGAVIDKESRRLDPASPDSIQLPKDDAEVDVLRDKLAALREQAQTVATQVQLDEEFLVRQESARKASGQQLRRIQEEFDTADTDAARHRASLQLRLAELQQEVTSSAFFLGAWRLYADRLDENARQAEVRAIEQALSASGLDTVFNERRAQEAVQRIEKEKTSVQKQIDSAQNARQSLEATIASLEQEHQTAANEEDRKRTEARLGIARESSEYANRIAFGGQTWSAALDELLRTWKTTLSVAQRPDVGAYLAARNQADQLLAQADPWREQIRRYLNDARARLEELESQPRPKEARAGELEEQRLALVRQRVAQLRDISALFESLLSHARQIQAESNQFLKQRSVSERVSHGFSRLGERVASLWNHELFTTEEKIIGQDGSVVKRMRGISVGKIVLATVGVLAGLFIAKTVALIIKNNIGRRFAVETARAAFLEKLLYYFLFALVVLTTLNWLRIPLTAFAFLGGALAIGVGFGAQTLMNNFISGLILLAEQKIKIGDIIEADGHLGQVMNLGTRCSLVRKFDGVDVLVPNSYLLEKNVINWTLADPHHRYDFVIGVSHGTATDTVIATFRAALEAQVEVLKEPAASVIFEAFASNALTFHLYYWLDIRRSDSNKVGSEIRLRIDRACREAGIKLA